MTSTPSPQQGIWTLTAPDGRTWQADSPLKAVSAEQRERVPAKVAVDRIFAACEEAQPAVLAVPGCVQAKTFAALYESNAQGIEIERLKMLLEKTQSVFSVALQKVDITFPVNAGWAGMQTRIAGAEGRFVTFTAKTLKSQDNAVGICELMNFAAEFIAAAPAIHEGGEHA